MRAFILVILASALAVVASGSLTALEAHEKQQFCAKRCGGLLIAPKGAAARATPVSLQSIKMAATERRRCRIECIKNKPAPRLPAPPPQQQQAKQQLLAQRKKILAAAAATKKRRIH